MKNHSTKVFASGVEPHTFGKSALAQIKVQFDFFSFNIRFVLGKFMRFSDTKEWLIYSKRLNAWLNASFHFISLKKRIISKNIVIGKDELLTLWNLLLNELLCENQKKILKMRINYFTLRYKFKFSKLYLITIC